MKGEQIQLRLTAKEKEKLKENAAKLGVSMSKYVLLKCVYETDKSTKIIYAK